MTNSPIEYVIEAIKAGKSIIEIIRGLRGRKISAEQRWYIDWLIRSYDTDRILKKYEEGTDKLSREYREGTDRIVAKLKNAEEHLDKGFKGLEEKFDKLYEGFRGVERNIGNYISELGGIVKGVLIRRSEGE